MKLFSISIGLISLSSLAFILIENVQETESVYAYAIKGYVQDIRHNPRLLVGGWVLKKAIKLKKLKLLLKLKKKLKLKFLAKKILLKFFLGRKKRSTDYFHDEIDLPEHSVPQINDNEIMPYFSMASEFDTDGCLPKSICEAMARKNQTYTMNTFERTVSEDLYVERPEDTSRPSFVYEYAAYFGHTTKDEKACAGLFSNCREKAQVLKKFMEETFLSDICEGPDQLIPQESLTNIELYDDDHISHEYTKTFHPKSDKIHPATSTVNTAKHFGSSSGDISFPSN